MSNTRPAQQGDYLNQIDGLRGVAVLAVIAYHLDFQYMQGGFLGVDLFMVISGYLITRSLINAESTANRLRDFYRRRVQRLLPTALVLIAVTTVVAASIYSPLMYKSLRWDALASLFYGANWRFIFNGSSYFDSVAPPSPLRHLWSLAIEEQFYLVWPFLVYATPRRFRKVMTITLICFSALAMSWLFLPSDPYRAYFGTDTRALALLIGALVALLAQNRQQLLPRFLAEAAFIVLLVAFVIADAKQSYMYHGGFLLAALFAALILAAIVNDQPHFFARFLSSRPMRAIGVRSYSLYLWHWPIVVFTSPRYLPEQDAIVDILRILLIIVCSELSFRAIEEFWRWKKLHYRRVALAASISMLATVSIVQFATHDAQSVPSYLSGGSSVTKSQSAASDSYRLKIRILGDSVVESLKDGFLKEAEKIGVDVELISISGCGFMPGATLGDDGSVYTPSLGCPKQVKNLLAQVNTNLKADLVIWFDAWDSLSREVDGEKLIVGQNDAILIALLRTTAKDFLNLGHKVIIVSTPERAHSAVLQPRGPAKTEINRYQYAIRNSIVAGDQPDDRIFTLNLNDLVCKDKSPCPDISEAGIRYRPTDGIHFEGSEVTTVAHWILSRSIALGQSGSM